MNKKIIIIAIIIILAVVSICYVGLNNYEKQVTIGNVNFTLPNGFIEGAPNELGDKNISNGTCTIFITYYNDTKILYYVNQYENFTKENNYTIISSNFTIGDKIVYQSVIEELDSKHYWFIKNNQVYSIYYWKNNDNNIDNVILELIKSA